MASIHKGGVLSDFLTLSFKGQHRRQVSIAYILFEAPLVELVFQLFLSDHELLDTRS